MHDNYSAVISNNHHFQIPDNKIKSKLLYHKLTYHQNYLCQCNCNVSVY